MSLAELVQSSGWKNFIAKLYGLGASVVIIGAFLKYSTGHWQEPCLLLVFSPKQLSFSFQHLNHYMKKLTGLWSILNLQEFRKRETRTCLLMAENIMVAYLVAGGGGGYGGGGRISCPCKIR